MQTHTQDISSVLWAGVNLVSLSVFIRAHDTLRFPGFSRIANEHTTVAIFSLD